MFYGKLQEFGAVTSTGGFFFLRKKKNSCESEGLQLVLLDGKRGVLSSIRLLHQCCLVRRQGWKSAVVQIPPTKKSQPHLTLQILSTPFLPNAWELKPKNLRAR